MALTGKNFIGSTLSGAGKTRFHAENPATGAQLEPGFYEATENEVDEAVELATSAFAAYSLKTGVEKAAFLDAIGDEIMELGETLIARCMEETGLGETRLKNERTRTVNQLKLFASHLREGSWVDARIDRADTTRAPAKPDIRSMQKPLGLVGVFGASNFPLAFSVAGGDTASALAAGCTVVVKGHPAHPGTSELVASAIVKAIAKTGMPEGTFSMVHGKYSYVGLGIVKHPQTKAVAFTGSFRGGKALFDAANARPVPIPVYAEMGSTNPVFILPGAMKERMSAIAKDLSASVTLGVGQFCTNPGLVFIPEGNGDKTFMEALSGSIGETACGVMLTSDIRNSYEDGLKRLASSHGVATIAKGKSEGQGFVAASSLFQTSAKVFMEDHTLEEEIFGPSTLAITFSGKNELIKAATGLRGHLTATIHGTEQDMREHTELLNILEQKAGRLIINGYPTGVEVTHAMVHSGPFPATTDSRSTSVGTLAIRRFTRHVSFQNFPGFLLPAELRDENPLQIWRLVDGEFRK
jgi:2,5-dioxopentanoate dehydrogenase